MRHNRHTVKKSSFIKKSSKKKYYLILFLFNLIFLSIFWINFYYCNIIISKLSSVIKILMTSKYKSCIVLQYTQYHKSRHHKSNSRVGLFSPSRNDWGPEKSLHSCQETDWSTGRLCCSFSEVHRKNLDKRLLPSKHMEYVPTWWCHNEQQ